MIKAVPFLTRKQIEDQASDLLIAYGAKYGALRKPPIPADEILNTHLKVKFDFDNLSRLLKVDADVFGATWLDKRQVIIDESLDPTNHPAMIGRYNFTVGHETGHWQLHRVYFENDPNQQQLFEVNQPPAILCRTSQAKEPIEWQADFFSSCFLIPKVMITEWCRTNYGFDQISLIEIKARFPSQKYGTSVLDDLLIERFVKPIAKDFAVSAIAMRIRLEYLGLVSRKVESRLVGL